MSNTHLNSSVSFVVPAYNEQGNILETLKAIEDFAFRHFDDAEIIVVDDGSTDQTPHVAENAASSLRIPLRVLRLSENAGKGAAVKAGVTATRKDLVVLTDADHPYKLDAFKGALERLDQNQADVILGARDLSAQRHASSCRLMRKISGRVFSCIVNRTLIRGIPDTQCGLKAFRGAVARSLFEAVTIKRFAYDVELVYIAQRRDLRIMRLPVVHNRSDGSHVRLWADSIQMLVSLLSIVLNSWRGRYE